MLITMAVYDTAENNRSWMTHATLTSLRRTVNWDRHRLMVSDNGSCEQTQALYREPFGCMITRLFRNGENLGTANALNLAWRHRFPGENVCKIDNDVVIHKEGWADLIEQALEKAPWLGICALKRKDLAEWPLARESFYRSKLVPLPHEPGEFWFILEKVQHCMGTCQAFRSQLLDKIGYLYQPSLYGFDDSLAATRCRMAGYESAFLHGIEIDHIDPGNSEFTTWKAQEAGRRMAEFHRIRDEYRAGIRPIYYDGGFSE